MKKHYLNLIERFSFVIFSLGILCVLPLRAQNFVRYSNQEIEKTEMYIHGNLYQKDFLLFMDILQKCHPAFAAKSNHPFGGDTVTRTGYQWADSCRSAKKLWCYMQQIAALINDGHTTLVPEINMNMIYPVILFFDVHGVYMSGINKEYESCLGKQVSQLNGHSLKDIFDCFRKMISSDNEVSSEKGFANFVQLYSMWEYTPYCSPDSMLHIMFTDGTSVSMPPIGRDKINMVTKGAVVRNKLINQNGKIPFHYTIVKEKKICYFQFNACMDRNSVRRQYQARNPNMAVDQLEALVSRFPRFDTFLDEMFDTMRQDSIKTLVIDVRNNSGGDSSLCNDLLARLKSPKDTKYMHSYSRFSNLWKWQYPRWATEYEAAFTRQQQPFEMGKLYDNYTVRLDQPKQETEDNSLKNEHPIFNGNVVFIQGTKTYSSAGILITVAQDNNIGVIIGEKSSYKPCHYGDLLAWQLPNTNFKGYVSYKLFNRPDASKCNESSLIPTVLLQSDWEDVLRGKDICWEWVLERYG